MKQQGFYIVPVRGLCAMICVILLNLCLSLSPSVSRCVCERVFTRYGCHASQSLLLRYSLYRLTSSLTIVSELVGIEQHKGESVLKQIWLLASHNLDHKHTHHWLKSATFVFIVLARLHAVFHTGNGENARFLPQWKLFVKFSRH